MVRSKNMQGEIVRSLKRDIITGKYTEGQSLPSAGLAEKFGVGQSVVREAITVLKADGFIQVKRGRNGGVIVEDRAMDILTDRLMERLLMGEVAFEQTAKLRLVLETDACRAGAGSADATTVARLRELNEEMLVARDFAEHTKLNNEFHVTIGGMGGNKLQAIFIKLLMHFTARAAGLISPDFKGMHSDDEHEPVIQALAERDAERACHFLRKHIENSNRRVGRLEKDFFSRAIRESFSEPEKTTGIQGR